MTNEDARVITANAVDSVAVAEERYPGAKLIGVQTTVVLQLENSKSVRFLSVMKNRE